jgi:hypothetical protein
VLTLVMSANARLSRRTPTVYTPDHHGSPLVSDEPCPPTTHHQERSVNTMLTANETDLPSAREFEPRTACFGVACFARRHCARYAAVSRSQASSTTLATCLNGKAYPLFVRIPESQGDKGAPLGELSDRMGAASTTEVVARA